jgi:hypothetical protein
LEGLARPADTHILRKGRDMKHMVTYTLKPECKDEHERLVRAVFDGLVQAQPAGLRYAALRSVDGLRYTHLVSHDETDGRNALTALPAFQAFAAGVKDRCAEPPVRTELTEIGSYGFFGR